MCVRTRISVTLGGAFRAVDGAGWYLSRESSLMEIYASGENAIGPIFLQGESSFRENLLVRNLIFPAGRPWGFPRLYFCTFFFLFQRGFTAIRPFGPLDVSRGEMECSTFSSPRYLFHEFDFNFKDGKRNMNFGVTDRLRSDLIRNSLAWPLNKYQIGCSSKDGWKAVLNLRGVKVKWQIEGIQFQHTSMR